MDADRGNQMPITPRNAIDVRFSPLRASPFNTVRANSRSRSPTTTRTRMWHFIENYPPQYQWMKVKNFPGGADADFRYWTIVLPGEGMFPGSWTIWWHNSYWTWLRFDKWADWVGLDLNSDSE